MNSTIIKWKVNFINNAALKLLIINVAICGIFNSNLLRRHYQVGGWFKRTVNRYRNLTNFICQNPKAENLGMSSTEQIASYDLKPMNYSLFDTIR